MNMFSLSETEFNNLQSVRRQLNLVSGLLCAHGADSSLFFAEDLNEFLISQVTAMRTVIGAVEARYELECDGPSLDYRHWLYALRVAGGYAHLTPTGSEIMVTEALTKAAQIDPDMNQVLEYWFDVIGHGPLPVTSPKVSKPAVRKRKAVTA